MHPSCEYTMIETHTLILKALGIYTADEIIADLKFKHTLTAQFDRHSDKAQIFETKSCGSSCAMEDANLVTSQYPLFGERYIPNTFWAHISASDSLSLGGIMAMVSILSKEVGQVVFCTLSYPQDQSLQDQAQLMVLTKCY